MVDPHVADLRAVEYLAAALLVELHDLGSSAQAHHRARGIRRECVFLVHLVGFVEAAEATDAVLEHALLEVRHDQPLALDGAAALRHAHQIVFVKARRVDPRPHRLVHRLAHGLSDDLCVVRLLGCVEIGRRRDLQPLREEEVVLAERLPLDLILLADVHHHAGGQVVVVVVRVETRRRVQPHGVVAVRPALDDRAVGDGDVHEAVVVVHGRRDGAALHAAGVVLVGLELLYLQWVLVHADALVLAPLDLRQRRLARLDCRARLVAED